MAQSTVSQPREQDEQMARFPVTQATTAGSTVTGTVVGGSARYVGALFAAAAVFVVSVAARLIPLERGGGLRSYGSYDDTVYFASAVGWVHGRWPYRDFLLIQPPGIVVALAPFAALHHWIGDSGALAAARLVWSVLGGLTAAGLVALLWRTSRLAAVVAGLFYALFWPAQMVERMTYLEGLQNSLLVAALLLLRPFGPPWTSRRAVRLAAVVAGIALGLSWSVKIWEIALIAVLAIWLAVRPRRRSDLPWFGVGVFVAVVAVCLPFFLHAPRAMWTMVVADQLHRPWHAGWAKRLIYITGTSHIVSAHRFGWGLMTVLTVVVVFTALACLRREARVVVLLFLAAVAVLLKSPPVYVHYGSFIAPSFAILLGVGAAEAVRLIHRTRSAVPRRLGEGIVAVVITGILVLLGQEPATAQVGDRTPQRIATLARGLPGCVAYDEPSTALALNLVSRDLQRGCPFIVDMGAVTHWTHLKHTEHGRLTPSQSVALKYLRHGSGALLNRYPPGPNGGAGIVGGWTVVARDHGLRLVRPATGRRS